MSTKVNSAVILAGGKGTRLAGLFTDCPKPLVPIAGKPFLDHLLASLQSFGIENVVLAVGHLSEQFKSYPSRAREFGFKKISLSIENRPLGSAGALWLIGQNFKESLGAEFIFVNGDTFLDCDLKPFLAHPLSKAGLGALGVCEKNDVARYGSVKFDKNKKITGFTEKGQQGPGFVNAGIFKFKSSIFNRLEKLKVAELCKKKLVSLEQDILPKIHAEFNVQILNGQFIDIGIPESYAEFNADMVLKNSSSAEKLILSTLIENGKIIFAGHWRENSHVLSDLKKLSFVKVAPSINASSIAFLDYKDLLILQNPSDEDLSFLNKKSAAKILVVQKSEIEKKYLIDAQTSPEGFANLNLAQKWNELKISQGLFNTFGSQNSPALFLDRDGVVIKHIHYIHKAKDVKLNTGIVALIKKANQKNWPVFIITNQSGLGREIFSLLDYDLVNQRTLELLAEKKCFVNKVLNAPYFTESKRTFGLSHSSLRKPRPGMIHTVANEFRVNLSQSVLVGDSASDVVCGFNAGIETLFLLSSPLGFEKQIKELQKYPIKYIKKSKLSADLID